MNSKFFKKEILIKITGIILLAFVAFMLFENFKIYQREKELKIQIETYKKQMEEIKQSTQNLKDEIANSNSVDYLEKIGYEKFVLVRPGETEYMFIETVPEVEVKEIKPDFWKSVTDSIFNAWQWLKNRF